MQRVVICATIAAVVAVSLAGCQAKASPIVIKSPYGDVSKDVTLVGHIVELFLYGPPNFGKNPKEDSVFRAKVLMLDKPIQVRDALKGNTITTNELQMFVDTGNAGRVKSLFVPGKVQVSGRLSFSTTGGQQTEVVIQVDTLRQLSATSVFSGVPSQPGNVFPQAQN